ncbi:sigma-70 family RNA polymerase sigma factor [Candidatus Poribacteria bacterium]|nr:sigma-70 family RNA polymerase sigma factor [Candidatus Poribacteria bacterium]
MRILTTDRELIHRIKNGESEAFNQIFFRYYKNVFSICLSILKNPEDAEEATSDTFIHAYFKLEQIKNPDKLANWLNRIAQNRSRDYLRSKKSSKEKLKRIILQLDKIKDNSIQVYPFSERELIEIIMKTIESLPQKDIDIIRARAEGLSHSEISDKLGISQQASRARFYRARKKVTENVRKFLYGTLGLFRKVTLKGLISGGIVTMKTAPVVKIGILVVVILSLGFLGFRVVQFNNKTKSNQIVNEEKQEIKKEIKTDSVKIKPKLITESNHVDANVGNVSNNQNDDVATEDMKSFVKMIDAIEENNNLEKSEESFKEEPEQNIARELRIELENMLNRCIELGEDIVPRLEAIGKIKDPAIRNAELKKWTI